MKTTHPTCPLCSGLSRDYITIPRGRDQAPGDIRYLRCDVCLSIFMQPSDRMEVSAERARYDAHENETDQVGYLNYLAPLKDAVLASLPLGSHGLDYGCGPNPVLAENFKRAGLAMDLYDPYFGPRELPAGRTYDFVTATEVVEHFHAPGSEFLKLRSLVRPGGSLWLMTQLWREDLDFRQWHYRRDPTHVFFYTETALEWISRNLGFRGLERPHPRVIRFVV